MTRITSSRIRSEMLKERDKYFKPGRIWDFITVDVDRPALKDKSVSWELNEAVVRLAR